MERKQIIQLLLTAFIAIIFVASYASFGNNGASNVATSITTTVVPQTAYASGSANAVVIGYGPIMSVIVNCNTTLLRNSTIYNISTLLTGLENNNSVNNFFSPNQTTFTVYTNNIDSYQLSSYLSSMLAKNESSCTSFKGQTQLLLPATINFTVASQHVPIPIPSNLRNYPLNARILPINSILPLRVSTLLTANGMIFGNLSITALGGS